MSITAPWVIEAIETLALGGKVRFINGPERSEVLKQITDAFLERADVLFWWSHLKVPWEQWHTEHGFQHLPEIAPNPDGRCWLITGLEDSEKSVFECTPKLASALIGESPFFEYAVVDPALTWMVIENHHDILIAAGDAAQRLTRLSQ